jgi:hypothetical protein
MGSTRKALAVVVGALCVAMLSSCSLTLFSGDDNRQADARMKQIADAVNDGDAAALTALFSRPALKEADNFDEGLDYFFSFFPDGGLTWERDVVGAESTTGYGEKTEVLRAFYDISVGGQEYSLFFADFTQNDIVDPDNLGIFALGVTPQTDDIHSGDAEPFYIWANSFHLRETDRTGYPGIYVPDENLVSPSQQAEARMELISAAVETQDAAALKAMFSSRALDEAVDLDAAVTDFLSVFHDGGLTWERKVANGGDPLTAQYKVSAGGNGYWLFFAEPAVESGPLDEIRLSALAVSPWTEPGEPDTDPEFTSWSSSWISDLEGPYGIHVGV